MLAAVAGILVLAGGVTAATLATLDEGRPPGSCPDQSLGCFELQPGEAVQIGILATASGPGAHHGIEAIQAAQLAVEGSPPILGLAVRLLARDDRCALPAALGSARELASDPPAKPPSVAVVGAVCPGTTSPAAQLLSDVGIPLLSWADEEVAFRDPPRSSFLRAPRAPAGPAALSRFERLFRDRYGGPPRGDQAWPAFWAVRLAVEATRTVAVRGPGDTVLVPRGPLFDTLRRRLGGSG